MHLSVAERSSIDRVLAALKDAAESCENTALRGVIAGSIEEFTALTTPELSVL